MNNPHNTEEELRKEYYEYIKDISAFTELHHAVADWWLQKIKALNKPINVEGWTERFDAFMYDETGYDAENDGEAVYESIKLSHFSRAIKSFISKTLSESIRQERLRLVEKLKGMKLVLNPNKKIEDEPMYASTGYNRAIDDVLKLISEGNRE